MQELYAGYKKQLDDRFIVESIDIPFNYSRINNLAAKVAKGKYLLFLNNDTEVITPEWMTKMVSLHSSSVLVVLVQNYTIQTIRFSMLV